MTVAGWGVTTSGGAKTDQMQEAKVTVVSDTDADKTFKTYDPELMIAAGELGTTACMHDSGGPLFASYKKLGKAKPGAAPAPPSPPYQYGIASFGRLTCTEAEVFTEVNAPSIREFITTSMNK